MSRTHHNPDRSESRRGFTLVEILFSILILGLLMGLLYVTFRSTRNFARSTTNRQTATSIKMGVSRFIEVCGFPPPLIRDQAQTIPMTVEQNGTSGVRFAVYSFRNDDGADATTLAFLRPATLTDVTATNPFLDYRYSLRTLPVYIAGACDVPLAPAAPDAVAKTIPIDGVVGPGMYKAKPDGQFDVPGDVKQGNASSTKRVSTKLDTLVDLSKKAVTVYAYGRDPSAVTTDLRDGATSYDANSDRWVELRDAQGKPIRYYRWINGVAYTQGTRTVYEVRKIDDLRLPPLVGRKGTTIPQTPADRDTMQNPELRNASWAIVMAGPDGVFGDEPLAELVKLLGPSAESDEVRVRIQAEKDNIVEVGQ